MKRALLTLLFCAGAGAALPVAALAQAAPSAMLPGGPMRPPPPSPSPAMRALIDHVRADARSAAYAALTPAHAAAVRSIAGQVAAKTIDFSTGMKQIDALITVGEAHAVDAAAETSRRAMFGALRQAGVGGGPMMAMGPRPMLHASPMPGASGSPSAPMGGGMHPGGPMGSGGHGGPMAWGGHGGPMHGHGGHMLHGPSASAYLIMISLTPEQLRAMMPARPQVSPAP